MPQITIDGKTIELEDGLTVIQACEIAGVEIPRFCYHERLKIAGNCRMCLVEIEKSPKPVASCAMPINDGMVVHTNTPMVQKAREGVMEFLLINHPLDCPICDQGGECDLQDQAFKYGKNTSRFHENKRSVQDKYMGPLIQTHMTRCIHCTRCIRFASDVAGIDEIGTIGRGEHMEVSTYLNQAITSELSGNLIDICPVGALTAKPYEFKYRSWELHKTRSIDVFDALGSNVRIDSKGLEIIRVLPEINEEINEEWISDKARFSYDGLKYQRLDRPYLKINGKLQEVSWEVALNTLSDKIKSLRPQEIAAICGNIVDCESIFAFKDLFKSIGSDNIDSNQFGYTYDTISRANYLFNTTISGIDKADFCLIIGANPRQNAPVLNARIGRNWRERNLKVARIGEVDNQTYKIQELGDSPLILKEILAGTHEICQIIKESKNPMMIVGDSVLLRDDALNMMSVAHAIGDKYGFLRDDWNGFNVLHNDSGSVGLLDIGFRPSKNGKSFKEILKACQDKDIKLVYLLAADEFDMSALDSSFVVYQGHHGDKGANRADLILPGCAYTEKDGIYVNLEGKPQYSRAIVKPLLHAKNDIDIFIELANLLGITLPFKSLEEIREQMTIEFPIFSQINKIIPSKLKPLPLNDNLNNEALKKVVINYYMNNVVSRASPTMLNCTKFILGQS
jgi:NADH-quinone oxidoreductase subunit G